MTLPAPVQVAPGVHRIALGAGALASNVYLVAAGPVWSLVDAGWARSAGAIRAAAEEVFGTGSRPASILLTSGAAAALRDLASGRGRRERAPS